MIMRNQNLVIKAHHQKLDQDTLISEHIKEINTTIAMDIDRLLIEKGKRGNHTAGRKRKKIVGVKNVTNFKNKLIYYRKK